ncbi:MAG TPA: LCP family protein [Streptosporangiaceae bacterium]|nr:LCP family protein [Streptosporangiaceae bacterium]
MTDWPDDWFRTGSAGGGSAVAGGQGAAGTAGAVPPAAGAEPPTVGHPIYGGAGSASPGYGAAGNGGQGYGSGNAGADQLTQEAAAPSPRAGQSYGSGRAAGPGYPGGSPGSAWPQQPPSYTPSRGSGGRSSGYGGGPPHRTGWRRWLRPRPIALALLVILSLAIIGSVSTYFYVDSKLVKKNVLVNYAGRPVQGDGTNWLITGSDSRQGLTDKQIRRLSTGFGIGGHRSDTIMVVHVPAGGGRPLLMSIPRDSWVDIPGYGYSKINAAFSYGGPALLAKVVQNLTGLRIDHYMGIGFGGFVNVVNDIGGVHLCLKAPLVDPSAGLHLKKGCQTLFGAAALGFVRSRHTYATQDLQRIQNQRIFLRALLRKLTSNGVVLNPFKSLPAATGVAGSLTVDKGTSLYQLISVAEALKNPITTTAPISNSNYLVDGQDALQLNTTELAELAKALNNGTPIPKGIITGSTLAG